MKRVVKHFVLLMFLYTSHSLYADDKSDELIPSLELLEFLGAFQAENGQWQDPMEIEEMLNLSIDQTKMQEKSDE